MTDWDSMSDAEIMATGAHRVCTPGPQKPFKYLADRARTRVVGPAPYVGEPFFYRWNVAVDRQRRWVAGDSWLEYFSHRMETP